MDPCMAICHLLRDSSLTITEKISTAVIPATTVSRINRRDNMIEQDTSENNEKERTLELRVEELEKRLNMFQTIVMKEKLREEGLVRYIEN